MSDPQPVPGRRTPPRAEPMQPDKPGQGDDAQRAGAASPTATDVAAEGSGLADSADPGDQALQEKRAEHNRRQSEDALRNVTTGYD